jgi:hypothetical protein
VARLGEGRSVACGALRRCAQAAPEAIPSEAIPSEASRARKPRGPPGPLSPTGARTRCIGLGGGKEMESTRDLPRTYHGSVPKYDNILRSLGFWNQTNYDPVWYPASVTGGSLPSSLPSPRTTWVELECLCQCRPPAAAPVSQHRSPTSAPTRSCARWITTATPSRRASHLGPPARSLNPGASTATLQSVSSTAATGARCTR